MAALNWYKKIAVILISCCIIFAACGQNTFDLINDAVNLFWSCTAHKKSMKQNMIYKLRILKIFIFFTELKVNVKWSRYRPGLAQRVGRGIAVLFHDRSTRRGEWSAARPGRTLPPGKTRYPFYRRLGGPQGRSGRAEYLVPTGIRSRTVQPVVSRDTDWANRPTFSQSTFK